MHATASRIDEMFGSPKLARSISYRLLEADRCAHIDAVPIKSPEQQGIQALHCLREQLKAQRTATINLMRGVLREFGIVIAQGAAKVRPAVFGVLEDGICACCLPTAHAPPCAPRVCANNVTSH